MKKIIIHIEEIKEQGAKVQFQIKLPSTVNQVTGVLVTSSPNTVSPIEAPAEARTENIGSIWLRIAENRDVFFADSVKHANHVDPDFHKIPQEGLAEQPEWWFSGTKRKFFTVTVPIEDTLIEGFYIDESLVPSVNYLLRIYLELEVND